MMNGISAAPDFMKFEFDPENGIGLRIEILSDKNLQQERTKKLVIYTFTGAAIGGGIGAAVSCGLAAPIGAKIGIGVGAACAGGAVVGAIGGGIIGYRLGLTKVATLNQNAQITESGLTQVASKINIILGTFAKNLLEDPNLDITCGISYQVMVIPTVVNCEATTPHLFEYIEIVTWISCEVKAGRTPVCPNCRGNISLDGLKIHKETGKKVIEVARKITQKMEAILKNIPSNFFSSIPNFEDTTLLQNMKRAIQEGSLLFDDTETMIRKIQNPDLLSREEAYALGHYIAQQFYGNIRAIQILRSNTSTSLEKLKDQGRISFALFKAKRDEVENWSEEMIQKIIPEDCTIMKQLFHVDS